MGTPTDVLGVLGAFLDPLSLESLFKCQKLLNEKISAAKTIQRERASQADINNYVSFTEGFVNPSSDDVLFAGLLAEVDSLGFKGDSGSDKPVNRWLNSDGEAYPWGPKSGPKTVNAPIDISGYPCITQLMQKINDREKCDLNSCLVTYYKNGKSEVRLHHDKEEGMDPLSPICVFTIGAERTVEFLPGHGISSDDPLLSLSLKEGSLYCMLPGCQDFFKHRVPSVKGCHASLVNISFRKKLPSPHTLTLNLPPPLKDAVTSFSASDDPVTETRKIVSFNSATKPAAGNIGKRVTVLFGTSMTTGLLTGNDRFINVSKSGAKIDDMPGMMENFHSNQTCTVEKVILSVGTNDIKHYSTLRYKPHPSHNHEKASKAMVKFRQPMVELIKKAQCLFPGAAIFVQSVIPMKNRSWYTVGNVHGFNSVLQDICTAYNCHYIDCFSRFLDGNGCDINRHLFRDWLHLNRWGKNILSNWFGYIVSRKSTTLDAVINLDIR